MTEQRIRLLDEKTINQIAAGEVVENPASVVKELVENALDSGASAVSIETRGGGRGLIRVSDNGCGMAHDDLILSLERHATSKLSEIEDLSTLGTLGFRGEALPSIASVSKISIHTAARDEAYILRAEGGRVLDIQLKPRRQGTTVEVRSLFFNVPVRKNFQKSVGWDRSEIFKILTKMALCYQNVAFTWVSEGEEQLSIPADYSLEERAVHLLGASTNEGMLHVEHANGPFHLEGYFSRPFFHRPNRTGQYLFVNGRAVISPFVSRKVLEGYGTRLSTHRYPLFVLHFTIPPSLIDVNVHPQKKEVRLRNEAEIGSFIIESVEKTFLPVKSEEASPPPVCMPVFAVSEQPASYFKVEEKRDKPPELFPCRPHVLSKMGNYLFLEDPEGIRVVDCKRARMRVAYEQLVLREKKNAVQHLLIPIQIEVAGAEKSALTDNLPLFEEFGFSIRHFGENTFIVDAIPTHLEGDEVAPFVFAFLEREDLPQEKKIAAALQKTMRPRSREEGEALVEALHKCKEPNLAPNGKPTHYLLTEKEMERIF